MSDLHDELRRLDKAHLWRAFTQMQGWRESDEDPLVMFVSVSTSPFEVWGRDRVRAKAARLRSDPNSPILLRIGNKSIEWSRNSVNLRQSESSFAVGRVVTPKNLPPPFECRNPHP